MCHYVLVPRHLQCCRCRTARGHLAAAVKICSCLTLKARSRSRQTTRKSMQQQVMHQYRLRGLPRPGYSRGLRQLEVEESTNPHELCCRDDYKPAVRSSTLPIWVPLPTVGKADNLIVTAVKQLRRSSAVYTTSRFPTCRTAALPAYS